jgi:hypothetical protein
MKKPCIISDHLIRFYPDIPDKLMTHIKSCQECSQKLQTIKLFAKIQPSTKDYAALEKAAHCPDDNLFAAYLDGELRGTEQKKVEQHLLTCSYCFHIAAEYVKEHHPATETIEQLLEQAKVPAIDIKAILEKVKGLSYDFINKKYPALKEWFNDSFESARESILAGEQLSLVRLEGTGFAGQSTQTIAKTIFIMQEVLREMEDDWDNEQIKKAIAKHCKRFKADRKLRNALIEYCQNLK